MSRFAVLLVFLANAIHAQTVLGTLTGRIVDSQRKAVPGAQVRMIETATARERSVLAGPSGEFVVALLPPGRYRLEVEKDSFRRHVESFAMEVSQEVRIEVQLLPGQATETVEVTASRGMLRTENAAQGTVIDNRTLTGLPLDGRNFVELSLLVPGAAPAAQGSATSTRGNVSLSINGAREDANGFVLDGVYNGNPNLNVTGLTPAVDAVREFEVVTSAYDASFGRNAGGQVNAVLKSGTNQIHGSAYNFLRNAAMDARNFFAPASEPDPKYIRNQFGVSLGGPLVKNRTFWFADYEGLRRREGITRVTNVPTALERTGDFSQSGLPFLIDPFTQQPFPENRIPANRIHPVGKAMADLYPLPNRNVPGQNYVSSPTLQDNSNQFDARVDHKLAAGDDLAVRYSFSDRSLFEPFTGQGFAAVPGYGNDVPRRAQNAMASETHAFSAALLNELRGSFSRNASNVWQQNRNNNLNQQVGLPSPWLNSRSQGLSFTTLTGYSPIGDEYNNPQQTNLNVWDVVDQMSWARGRSLWKFGGGFRRTQQNAFRDVQARGLISFLGFTGSSLAEMLQGLTSYTGLATVDNPQYLRSSSYHGFVNNTWRAGARLTLTLGARYEFNSPPVDRYDRANVYDPAQEKLVPVGKNGFPRAGYDADGNNFAPRVGIAWTPRASGTTVVRGGYGFYYDQSPLAPGEGLYFNAPYYVFRLYFSLPTSPVTLSDPFPANYPYPTPPSALAFQRNLRTPYMQNWNFSVQQALGAGSMIEAGYTGSKGTKLITVRDSNQPGPSAAPINPRPNYAFDDINLMESRGNSAYHSLQARFQQRFHHGLTALASYTFGKSIDEGSGFFPSSGDPNFPQDSRNMRLERGRSNFDVRQRFVASYAWDLPLGQGRLRSGWQTMGIWTFQSGRPFTVALLRELDNSGTGRSALGFGANDRPNVSGQAALDHRTPEQWFNTSAFSLPPRGTFGNAGRNIVDGPGLATINASLIKNLAVTERVNLQFRLEAFNLLNRTNFDLPDNFAGSPTFGAIQSAGNPRRVQLGVKILF